eukprot:TRINITY_DN179_c0_g1_i1.p1 TRINITY_DN179_c0_g1~~TRINITY_DN179_c0_g1_i1.p1  ORF type:complete len:325 (-),score=71.80 TRINITY_DN179_c0_g1_i1:80-1054(-)
MKSVIVLLIAFFGLSLAYTEKEYQNAFTAWMQSNSKSYAAEEFRGRYSVFKQNMDFVQQWNANPENTHTVGLNALADLSNEEYKKMLLGTRFDGTARLAAAKPSAPQANPTSVNWVTKGAVTPIKNQGQCGSCWSFSTTGSTEGAHFLKTGNLVSLSEQNLMDCSGSYGNNGCNGGLMDDAFKYIIANKGIDTEASYPYTAQDGTCHYKAANSGATLSTYTDVNSGDESALETAAVKQPVSVAIDASHTSFQLYTSGVYNEKACSTTQLDHGVLVAGYGTSGSTPYWLVKNSWGTSWGQAGYIWMSKNKSNQCGIATMASYPTA